MSRTFTGANRTKSAQKAAPIIVQYLFNVKYFLRELCIKIKLGSLRGVVYNCTNSGQTADNLG